jgi:hypothetical protein
MLCTKRGKALWEEKRTDILTDWIKTRPGSRPWAWWVYDAPEPRHEHESERAFLARHGLLAPGEREG